jgi:hypothetical protein
LNVASCFGADFLEEDIVSLRQFPSLCFRDVPVLKVDFVGEEGYDDSFSPLVFDIVDPFLDAFEGIAVGDVVDYNCYRSVSDIVGDQCFESFLARSVPELKTYSLVF